MSLGTWRLGEAEDDQRPRATPGRAPDGSKHVSARQRFRDGGFEKRAWTPELALRVAGVSGERDRGKRLRGIQDAIAEGRLPDPAIEALIWDGYKELA